ncbi:hypothetical protein F5J12DRAFT_779993 [Pisolithus orientalis]|uniref:uncharacterized protein n=1 Tax=Pisolithus orientalis TaxID=936130 RepID=UPI00222591CF|nr:uncharacterized protein F5J12DRAFT_779993 [Pisolithus orientalis]KAI6028277.1 hypothetical protein F5J12DRAFT_779993 [Pisolithus orientalis]
MNLSMLGTLFGMCWLLTSKASEFPYLNQAKEQLHADIADLETKASSPIKDVTVVGAYPQSSFECQQARPLDFIGFQSFAEDSGNSLLSSLFWAVGSWPASVDEISGVILVTSGTGELEVGHCHKQGAGECLHEKMWIGKVTSGD